jgi:Transcription factor zinc-finger
MQVHAFASARAGLETVELNLCFSCHGIWFDPQENLKLAPAGVVALFKLLHAHRGEARAPLALTTYCPRCDGALTQGFDVVTSGRYITYRCARRHGRFSAFSSFMIEKGFVRLLTQPEIDDIAQRVAVIHCTSCGAPVDLRKDHACPHCRSAFSLLDPKAVERALSGYKRAAEKSASSSADGDTGISPSAIADALMALERDRLRALAERRKERAALFSTDVTGSVDLWAIGIALVAKILD